MRIHQSHELPLPAEQAARRIADPHTFARTAARLRATRHDEDVLADGGANDGFRVRAAMTVPTSGVPAAAARVVGSTIDVTYLMRWSAADTSGARSADLDVDIAHLPVAGTARLDLVPTGPATCRIDVDGDITASVPLVGRSIEKAALPAMEDAIAAMTASVIEG